MIRKVNRVGPITWKSSCNHIAIVIVKNDFIYVLENINGENLVHEYIEFCRMHRHDFVLLRRLYRPEIHELDISNILQKLEKALEDISSFELGITVNYSSAIIGFVYHYFNWLDPEIDWTTLQLKDFSPECSLSLNHDVKLGTYVLINKM